MPDYHHHYQAASAPPELDDISGEAYSRYHHPQHHYHNNIKSSSSSYYHENNHHQTSQTSILTNKQKQQQDIPHRFRAFRKLSWFFLINTTLLLLIYYLPEPPVEPVATPHPIDRLPFVGPLSVNSELDQAKALFVDQLHAPEALAVDSRGNFYTGVEGGFIIYFDTRREIYTKVALLNSKQTLYNANKSDHLTIIGKRKTKQQPNTDPILTTLLSASAQSSNQFNYCDKDVKLYGTQARHSPELIHLSRCSRPLGIRLSPDETYLYVLDPYNGLFLVDLTQPEPAPNFRFSAGSNQQQQLDGNFSAFLDSWLDFNFNGDGGGGDQSNTRQQVPMRRVTLLIDSAQSHKSLERTGHPRILFADDLAVDWGGSGASNHAPGDIIYMTDCSVKWRLRQLSFLLLEHDETGRLLRYDTKTQQLSALEQVTPVRYRHNYLEPPRYDEGDLFDYRPLYFPNGVELMDDRQALLINDLGHARILKHYIGGPLKGHTEHWARVPGRPDNIKRGADRHWETYWVACACAIKDDTHFDFTHFLMQHAIFDKLLLKIITMLGRLTEFLGTHLLRSPGVRDYGFALRNAWLTIDPICWHGIVVQYDAAGRPLRSLHAPTFGSKWKLISEAREILVPSSSSSSANLQTSNSSQQQQQQHQRARRFLYLGSVYNSYLGRLEL